MCDVAERLEQKGRLYMIFELVEDRIITLKQGASKAQMSVSDFESAMKEAGFEILD